MRFEVIRKRLSSALAAVGGSLTLAGSALAQTPAVNCHVEWAPMRDGVKLATEVYTPSGPGPFPVVLQRSPYNRGPPNPGSNCNNTQLQFLASNGYAALLQDARGRYRSQGVMNAMQQEASDGYDAVEWAAAQQWSTGKVGLFGGSYVGLTQWQPAIHTPPHLAAIAPQVTASDYHDKWTYVNGAFDLWFAQSWLLLTFAGEQYMRDLEAAGASSAEVQSQTAAWIANGRANILTDGCGSCRSPRSTATARLRRTITTGSPTRTTTTSGRRWTSRRATRTSRCLPSTSAAGTTSSRSERSATSSRCRGRLARATHAPERTS